MLEPTEALESAENALRLIVRQLLGDGWQGKVTAPRLEQFKERMAEEAKRRDGVQTSSDLLQFTDFTDLTGIITEDWETFKGVFDDQARLKAYFGVYEDVRNTIAHSRALVDYERELLSGMTKHIRNQVALFRMGTTPSTMYYPVIESVDDSFGNTALDESAHARGYSRTQVRLNVGDNISFTCRASDPIGRDLHWILAKSNAVVAGYVRGRNEVPEVIGTSVELRYTVKAEDYGESFALSVYMHNSSQYRRLRSTSIGGSPGVAVDDSRHLLYAVNPPIYL